MEPRMIPIDRIRIQAGHNARGDVGDVSELAASIQALGVLQALTVEVLGQENGQPVYRLVAGERRLTAARQVGLAQVPCVVQDFDERQRVAAMLAENLQREDLSVLEEARGIKRLGDMGLSQREIGRLLGRAQSHVSKRLSLLTLPEEIQAAIDRSRESGGITVPEALELAKLVDHPERLATAFERRGYYGGVTGNVRSQLAELERERTRAEAHSRLASEGVRVLHERDFYSWTDMRERPLTGQEGCEYAAIPLPVEEHRDFTCHAAVIDREGKVIYICADPLRHSADYPRTAAQIVQARDKQEAQREGNRLRREAAHGRRQAMERVLASANTSQLAFAACQITDHWRLDETKQACALLGLEPVEERGPYGTHRDYRAALSTFARGSMAAAIKALLALALAGGEECVGGTWASVGEMGRRHMAVLAAAGYEPNETDRKFIEEEADAYEPRVCRGCGCSEQEPCHGGCHWVEDPQGVGDLCSRCLDEDELVL